MTIAEAKAEMLAWAKGEKSHWNDIAGWSGSDPAHGIAECARADAAEVDKWASVFVALVLERSHMGREGSDAAI